MLAAVEAKEVEQVKVGHLGASTLAIHSEEAEIDPLTDITARFGKLVSVIKLQ